MFQYKNERHIFHITATLRRELGYNKTNEETHKSSIASTTHFANHTQHSPNP